MNPKTSILMIDKTIREYLLPKSFNAAVRAGAAIMKIYKNSDDYDISLKSDKTPITIADRLAHKTIKEYLGSTRIPILSEEGREMLYGSSSGSSTRSTARSSSSRATTSLRSTSPLWRTTSASAR